MPTTEPAIIISVRTPTFVPLSSTDSLPLDPPIPFDPVSPLLELPLRPSPLVLPEASNAPLDKLWFNSSSPSGHKSFSVSSESCFPMRLGGPAQVIFWSSLYHKGMEQFRKIILHSLIVISQIYKHCYTKPKRIFNMLIIMNSNQFSHVLSADTRNSD